MQPLKMTFINRIIIDFFFVLLKSMHHFVTSTDSIIGLCFQLFPIGYIESFTSAPLLLRTDRILVSKELRMPLSRNETVLSRNGAGVKLCK